LVHAGAYRQSQAVLLGAVSPWEVAASPLALVITLLPWLLTLGAVVSAVLAVRAARRAIDRLARNTAWLLGS
jgi:hypothetical protein